MLGQRTLVFYIHAKQGCCSTTVLTQERQYLTPGEMT